MIEQVKTGPNVMEPSSGSYGSKVENDRIKQSLSLPGQGQPGSASTAPTPPSPGPVSGAPSQAQPPPGLPGPIMRPSSMPDMPVSTPLSSGAPSLAMTQTAAQKRLAVLDALSTNPNVSEETREWAKDVVEKLAARSR